MKSYESNFIPENKFTKDVHKKLNKIWEEGILNMPKKICICGCKKIISFESNGRKKRIDRIYFSPKCCNKVWIKNHPRRKITIDNK